MFAVFNSVRITIIWFLLGLSLGVGYRFDSELFALSAVPIGFIGAVLPSILVSATLSGWTTQPLSAVATAFLPPTISSTRIFRIAILESKEDCLVRRKRELSREYNLTYRESEVLLLMAEGLKRNEIAMGLYVSAGTAKSTRITCTRKWTSIPKPSLS